MGSLLGPQIRENLNTDQRTYQELIYGTITWFHKFALAQIKELPTMAAILIFVSLYSNQSSLRIQGRIFFGILLSRRERGLI